MDEFAVRPGHEADVAQLGIRDVASASASTGGALVAVHPGRSVVRIDGDLYLKRFVGKAREARAERQAMDLLAAGPGPDPVPLAACGEEGANAFLLTVLPSGLRPLGDALRALRGAERRVLLHRVGERIRALHDRGLTCPDLLAHHLIVGLPDRVFLIDAGRLGRRAGVRARARDLAALDQTLPPGDARATDRVRILHAYLGGRPSRHAGFLAAFRRQAAKLARRSRHRRDRLVIAPGEDEFFAGLGVRTFADLMEFDGPGARCLRRLADRENWRIEAGGRVFFVKRHRPVSGLDPTPAALEWDAVRTFARAGIRVMRAVAMAEDVTKGSTIWVERAAGVPLDDLLRAGVPDPMRREFAVEAGTIAARMRAREMHHRDFYACHLIADADAPAGRRLTVIDLQRARRKDGLRERWFVKDAAQLWHSAPRPPVTRSDAVRFLRAAFGVERLAAREGKFARRVLRKASRI